MTLRSALSRHTVIRIMGLLGLTQACILVMITCLPVGVVSMRTLTMALTIVATGDNFLLLMFILLLL